MVIWLDGLVPDWNLLVLPGVEIMLAKALNSFVCCAFGNVSIVGWRWGCRPLLWILVGRGWGEEGSWTIWWEVNTDLPWDIKRCVRPHRPISTSKLQGSHLRLAAHISWLGKCSGASFSSTWRSFTGWWDQGAWVWEQDCGTNICIAANLKLQAKTNPNTAMADLWATTYDVEIC